MMNGLVHLILPGKYRWSDIKYLDEDNLFVLGLTTDNNGVNDFPVLPDPLYYNQTQMGNSIHEIDMFAAYFNADRELLWASIIGGWDNALYGSEKSAGLAFDDLGRMFVVGGTVAQNYPYECYIPGVSWCQQPPPPLFPYRTDVSISRFGLNPSIGIEEQNVVLPEMTLSPNPAIDQISILTENVILKDATITLITMAGKRLVPVRTNSAGDGVHFEVFVGDLPNGVYVLELATKEIAIKEKFTVIR